jgi:hypothetical protein
MAAGCGVGIGAGGAAAPHELAGRKSGKEGGILGVGVDIVDLIVVLDDDRIDSEEDCPILVFR